MMEKNDIFLAPIQGVQARLLPCCDLVGNKGQIAGLPGNPRSIKLGELRKLVQSIRDYPDMVGLRELLVYPYKGKYVVIGGNQRLAALKQLGYGEVPCKVIPGDVSVDVLKAYMLRDNAHFGEWDFDKIDTSAISAADLDMARVRVPEMSIGHLRDESVKRAAWHASTSKGDKNTAVTAGGGDDAAPMAGVSLRRHRGGIRTGTLRRRFVGCSRKRRGYRFIAVLPLPRIATA